MAKGTLNKVILIGRAGADPVIRQTAGTFIVANINLATNESYKDKSGQVVESTEWHKVVFFGKTAETVEKYVKKGASLFIEGKLRTNKWTDKNNQERYTVEIIADNFQFIGSNNSNSGNSNNNYRNNNNDNGNYRNKGSYNNNNNSNYKNSNRNKPYNAKKNDNPRTEEPKLEKFESFDDDDIPF